MPGKKTEKTTLSIRKAVMSDVPEIQALVNRFANERKMLSRSLSEIYENVRDFFVIEDKGAVVGSAALHVFWGDLAEVRALAVAKEYQGLGLGRRLISACRNDARRMGIKKIFALTFQQDFFHKVGFTDISKDELPHKVWSDCIKCPMFPNCDEIAVIMELDGAPEKAPVREPKAAAATSKRAGRRK